MRRWMSCLVMVLAVCAAHAGSVNGPPSDGTSELQYSGNVSKRVRAYFKASSDAKHEHHDWFLILVEKNEVPNAGEREGSLRLDGQDVCALETSRQLWLWSLNLTTGSLYLNHRNHTASPEDFDARYKYSLENGRVFCLSDSGTVAQVRVDRALVDRVVARRKLETRISSEMPTVTKVRPGWHDDFIATLRKESPVVARFIEKPTHLDKEDAPEVTIHRRRRTGDSTVSLKDGVLSTGADRIEVPKGASLRIERRNGQQRVFVDGKEAKVSGETKKAEPEN